MGEKGIKGFEIPRNFNHNDVYFGRSRPQSNAAFEIQAALNLLVATSKVLRTRRTLMALLKSLAIACKLVVNCNRDSADTVVVGLSEGVVPR